MELREPRTFYINGRWVDPADSHRLHEVIDPVTEQPSRRVAWGCQADVDHAVAAAAAAFEHFSRTSRHERAALLRQVIAIFERRLPEIAQAISADMGAPAWLANEAQAPAGLGHFVEALRLLDAYEFEYAMGTTRIVREPVGVCGLITPWNWPISQMACKVAFALAAGCTMVLKPSELAPLSAVLMADLLDKAGVPHGVFNLVHGDGAETGAALARHPAIDMLSFTGSNRAGVLVSQAAAATVKRVAMELGGNSANIVLDDADLKQAVAAGVMQCMINSGQNCNAPARMLVPRQWHAQAAALAATAVAHLHVAAPDSRDRGSIGPLASRAQFDKVQRLVQQGIDEGAQLVAGGLGRPQGFVRGYYVRPTVFANVSAQMAFAREEIFGPVLSIMPYDDEDHAVAIANDTIYGLCGYVQSGSVERARNVARRLRVGNVHLNGAGGDLRAPFGGYKQSGNGREWGAFGLEEFLEVKAVLGWKRA
ncbi:aldehyde dehydrogenase family protein [Dyella silvatica]|uniref:aldehyde dehydrogenase family protein n=1 Tax=Dyella silvatica TaxID=2992128 RepID=UPI002259C0BA|nr:aldehyde dehydrogenase family protein [Dyella silvatica]